MYKETKLFKQAMFHHAIDSICYIKKQKCISVIIHTHIN